MGAPRLTPGERVKRLEEALNQIHGANSYQPICQKYKVPFGIVRELVNRDIIRKSGDVYEVVEDFPDKLTIEFVNEWWNKEPTSLAHPRGRKKNAPVDPTVEGPAPEYVLPKNHHLEDYELKARAVAALLLAYNVNIPPANGLAIFHKNAEQAQTIKKLQEEIKLIRDVNATLENKIAESEKKRAEMLKFLGQ